jgi:hypothetical protein
MHESILRSIWCIIFPGIPQNMATANNVSWAFIESNQSNPENQLMYTCNHDEAQRVILRLANVVREEEYRHAECPEELDALQLLCQYLHVHIETEYAELIERVFCEMGMTHLLKVSRPSSSPSQ